MPANAAMRDYLMSRRSVGQAFLKEPGPNAEELEQILTIGTRVPDHGKLNPWRLVLYTGDDRALIGEKLAAMAKAKNPNLEEAELERELMRFLPPPLTIGVLSSPKAHPTVPEWEQFLSAGNVAFNLVNAAFALGYAANWVSRWYSMDAEAARMLGAREGERFVAFVQIGTPSAVIEDRPRPKLDSIVSRWQSPE
ncbi:MAG: nitroreductase [Devosia sp.]|uniref:nitroreductase family protein n=1 Tax=Devosia sp. TaxID=1871048 RepID=UPI0026108A1E|nr:nitroreductase [Devosia sp.]MDB5528502.1 nitroreductase [Devosia sp.]